MSLLPSFQNRKRRTVTSVGSVTTFGIGQLLPGNETEDRFVRRAPSGAAVSPDPGSNDSPFPQSTVS